MQLDPLFDKIKNAHRFRPEPGDIVLIEVADDFTDEESKRLAQIWTANVPETRVLVMQGSRLLGLLNTEGLTTVAYSTASVLAQHIEANNQASDQGVPFKPTLIKGDDDGES